MGFAPSPGATAEVTRALAGRVRRSLRVGADRLHPDAPELSRRIRDVLDTTGGDEDRSPGADPLLHPEFARWQHHLNAVLKRRLPMSRLAELSATLPPVLATVAASDARAASPAGIRGVFDAGLDSAAVREVLAEAVERRAVRRRQTDQAVDRVAVAPFAVDAQAAALLSRSVEAIELIWPEMYDEMRHTVRVMVIYDGEAPADKMVSFTDSAYHGAVFMKRQYLIAQAGKGESAGDLLHEATHNFINASLLAGARVFSEPVHKSFTTTFRVDPRPLPGVYHQLMVLARLAEFYRRAELLGLDGFPTLATYRPGVHGGSILDELTEMLHLMRTEAPLTEYGTEMIDSVGGLLTGLQYTSRT